MPREEVRRTSKPELQAQPVSLHSGVDVSHTDSQLADGDLSISSRAVDISRVEV